MTVEDESGFANLVIFQNLFDTFRKVILQSKLIMVEGKLQREGDVIHVIVSSCHDFSKLLLHLTPDRKENASVLTFSRADERAPLSGQYKISTQTPDEAGIIPGGRNFK